MAGFLTKYAETTKVDLGDDYWAEVKTHLNRRETKEAQKLLLRPIMKMVGEDQETTAELDLASYQQAVAMSAIIAWNLTDENGVDLPLAPDSAKAESIDRLPSDVFDKILAVVEGIKPKNKEEAAKAKVEKAKAEASFRS